MAASESGLYVASGDGSKPGPELQALIRDEVKRQVDKATRRIRAVALVLTGAAGGATGVAVTTPALTEEIKSEEKPPQETITPDAIIDDCARVLYECRMALDYFDALARSCELPLDAKPKAK